MRAVVLLAALAACADHRPQPPVAAAPAVACRIRPVTVSSRDFFSPATLAEIRRVNRDLRRHCAG